jgi:hypothetical protein
LTEGEKLLADVIMLTPSFEMDYHPMKDREPTVRSRALGDGLRRAAAYAGYNGTQIADELGWSQGRVSRLLAGKRGGSGCDVSAFLAVCRIIGAERERLLGLAGEHTQPDWFVQHGPMVPKQVQTLIDLEAWAASIWEFQAVQVPERLQTPGYACAVLSRSANVPDEEIDERVHTRRLVRHELLNRPRPPLCVFFLDEYVVHLPVGGATIMAEQLHHLLRIAQRPNVILRVVPARVGAHAGMAGSFTLLGVRDFKPIVYLENETSSLFLELPVEVEAYRKILAKLDEVALNEDQSRDLISTLALRFEGRNDGLTVG